MTIHFLPGSIGLLSPISHWLSDPLVSEILINEPQWVWIEKNNQLQEYSVPIFTPTHLQRLFQLIANENEQYLSEEKPLLSGNLQDGNRVQLCLPPTAKYHTLSIRKNICKNFTLSDYEQTNFYQSVKLAEINNLLDNLSDCEQELFNLYKNKQWSAFLKKAIALKKTLVISGGTSSGKTTFLNACLQEIDLNERLIILEDTRELIPPHKNKIQFLASKGQQGKANITMQDLVQCSLRLRPDRIIMGEIRGAEIMDFISACSTGHEGSITSIHANNPRVAFLRMIQMYKLNNVPAMSDQDILRELQQAIDIIVQLAKTTEGKKMVSIYYKSASDKLFIS
ncbi:MAG: P-type DNA transfer ATPase VirB11 [Gammaproteobacteria bacterium RIFCSPHIGHO2_12_FULL_35_23]|nr:MAG: P-type DNA transfer ATPase VirB11 [Gammaproteobacteria bacterium RIFCSPHIGHO2_12_FULL_35_23]